MLVEHLLDVESKLLMWMFADVVVMYSQLASCMYAWSAAVELMMLM